MARRPRSQCTSRLDAPVYAAVALTPVALMLFVRGRGSPTSRRACRCPVRAHRTVVRGVALGAAGADASIPAVVRHPMGAANHGSSACWPRPDSCCTAVRVHRRPAAGHSSISAARDVPVWAATISTVPVLALVILAERRRRHHPRYDGCRLTHVRVARMALITAWLHVWWLRHLVDDR